MFRYIYSAILYLLQPLLLLCLLRRSIEAPLYRQRINERYGFYSRKSVKPKPNGVLIHAASVGEVLAARPLVNAILQQYPDLAVRSPRSPQPVPSGLNRLSVIKSAMFIYLMILQPRWRVFCVLCSLKSAL